MRGRSAKVTFPARITQESHVVSQGAGSSCGMVAPVPTSRYLATGALVPAGRILSLDPQKIRVLGEKSGLLAGVGSYDSRRWWVIWGSRKPLRQEQVCATLDAGAVENLAGNVPQKLFSGRFRVR